MKSAKIFLVGENEEVLHEMVETPYERENILQLLLEKYTDLLPGDQINPEDPRRWMLVKRELGIPGETQGTNVWSLDHLFLDQDGIPTFVECKRASDTRSRREVVAQMLDYAANGVAYWSMDTLRQAAAESAAKNKSTLDDEVLRLTHTENPEEIEDYWTRVEANLRKGVIRLLFVANETTPQLRRLVEFLNEKMADVEVLIVEVKQYLGKANHKVIVPRVIGLTENARTKKGNKTGSQGITNREAFLAQCDKDAVGFFADLLNGAAARGDILYWGKVGFSIRKMAKSTGELASLIYGYPPNKLEVYLGHLNLAKEQENEIRKMVKQWKVFVESGKKTLRTTVDSRSSEMLLGEGNRLFHLFDQLAEIG